MCFSGWLSGLYVCDYLTEVADTSPEMNGGCEEQRQTKSEASKGGQQLTGARRSVQSTVILLDLFPAIPEDIVFVP